MTFAIRARVMVLALAGSLALAAAVPFLLDAIATAPSGEVAGTVATPAPSPSSDPAVASSAPDPLDPPGAAPATMVRLPDPIGDRSAPARRPADPSTLTGYVWPLPGSRLTLPFGPSPWGSRVVDGESFHDGLDLATFCGDRVVAAHDGTVLAAGRRYDRHIGWLGDLTPYQDRLDAKSLWITLPIVVVIDDGNDYRSIYAHFRDVVVKPGDVVKAGQLLGYEGMTGRASGCHVHYGLFSPFDVRTFGIREDVVGRMLVPDRQIARIDPRDVLPPLESAGIH